MTKRDFRIAFLRMARLRPLAGLPLAGLLALTGGAVSASSSAGARSGPDCVIQHVTVLPMTRGATALDDQDVVIRKGRILSIAAARARRASKGSCHIDGRGKFLMPGLSDMHVHIHDMDRLSTGGLNPKQQAAQDADLLLPFAANGVLQVFNLSSSPASLRQRDAVERGDVFGPRQALAFMIDGSPPMNGGGMAQTAATPEEGLAAVRAAHASGYDAIKTYSALDFDTFQAIRAEAVRLGMKVMGHIPLRGQARTADLLAPGFSMVAHAEEYAYQTPSVAAAAIPQFAAMARDRGVWLDTTLVLNQRVVERTVDPGRLLTRPELRFVPPAIVAYWRDHNNYATSMDKLPRRRAVVEYNPLLIREFARSGVPFVTGTDTGVAGIMPGFGLLDELEGLAAIGLSNIAILEATTRLPAEYLGVGRDRGTVEIGKRADLILLDADPRADIGNVRKLAAVFLDGRLYRREQLQARLADLARRYAAAKPPEKSARADIDAIEFGHDEH